MRVAYAVTFEFEHRAPLTHRGSVAAAQPSTCARQAVKQAQVALKPRDWSSVVCVLLERLPEGA